MAPYEKQPYELTLDSIESLLGFDARQTMIGLRNLAFSHIDDAVAVNALLEDREVTMYMVEIGDLTQGEGVIERFFIEWQSNNTHPQRMPQLFHGYVVDGEVHDCGPIKWQDLSVSDWPWLAQQVRSHAPRI